MKIKETIIRDNNGKELEHYVTIPKSRYDDLLYEKRNFIQDLLTKLIDLDNELNKSCADSWRGLPSDEARASWLDHLSHHEEMIRFAFINVLKKELKKYEYENNN